MNSVIIIFVADIKVTALYRRQLFGNLQQLDIFQLSRVAFNSNAVRLRFYFIIRPHRSTTYVDAPYCY